MTNNLKRINEVYTKISESLINEFSSTVENKIVPTDENLNQANFTIKGKTEKFIPFATELKRIMAEMPKGTTKQSTDMGHDATEILFHLGGRKLMNNISLKEIPADKLERFSVVMDIGGFGDVSMGVSAKDVGKSMFVSTQFVDIETPVDIKVSLLKILEKLKSEAISRKFPAESLSTIDKVITNLKKVSDIKANQSIEQGVLTPEAIKARIEPAAYARFEKRDELLAELKKLGYEPLDSPYDYSFTFVRRDKERDGLVIECDYLYITQRLVCTLKYSETEITTTEFPCIWKDDMHVMAGFQINISIKNWWLGLMDLYK